MKEKGSKVKRVAAPPKPKAEKPKTAKPRAVRNAHDYYPTDERVVKDFLGRWSEAVALPSDGVWVEPAVGDGAFLRAVEAQEPGLVAPENWRTCDVREVELDGVWQRPAWQHHRGDFLALKVGDPFAAAIRDAAMVITNPPYAFAEEFVRKARELCPRAFIVMLLRNGLLEADERISMYADLGAPDLYPVVPRPSFGPSAAGRQGATDAQSYSWFVFHPFDSFDGPRQVGEVHPARAPWRDTRRTLTAKKQAAKEEAKRAKEAAKAARRGVQYDLFAPAVAPAAGGAA